MRKKYPALRLILQMYACKLQCKEATCPSYQNKKEDEANSKENQRGLTNRNTKTERLPSIHATTALGYSRARERCYYWLYCMAS